MNNLKSNNKILKFIEQYGLQLVAATLMAYSLGLLGYSLAAINYIAVIIAIIALTLTGLKYDLIIKSK